MCRKSRFPLIVSNKTDVRTDICKGGGEGGADAVVFGTYPYVGEAAFIIDFQGSPLE